MRIIIFILIFLAIGCAKESETALIGGVSSISSAGKCEKVEQQAKEYINSLLTDLTRPATIPEGVVGLQVNAEISGHDLNMSHREVEGQLKVVRDLFFTNTLFNHDLVVRGEDNKGWSASIGITAGDSIEAQLLDEQQVIFGENTECQINVEYRADWIKAQEPTTVRGEVRAIKTGGDFAPLSGRLYMTRIGPGRMGKKFSTLVKNGLYNFGQKIIPGHYKVEFGEKVSPNYKVVATNVEILPKRDVQQDFELRFPCRWNVRLSGHIDEFDSFLWFWGDWEEKMQGSIEWNMMPIATLDMCTKGFPIFDQQHQMELYNQRYNLRTTSSGFRSMPQLKIYRDIEQEELKLFIGISLRDQYDFGQGKSDYLTIINSCSADGRDAQMKECYVSHLEDFLKAGEKFSIRMKKELEDKVRVNFLLEFEPLF